MSFSCVVCEKSFSSKQRLEYHTKRNVCASLKEDKQDSLKCLICNKIFSSKQMLEYHIENSVCKAPDDMSIKMHEMAEMIRTLQKQVSVLENENVMLKDRVKTLETKASKDNNNDNHSIDSIYKRICSAHVRTVMVNNGTYKTIFRDDDLRYAATRVQKLSSDTILSIFAKIDSNDNYHPLSEPDITYLHKIFRSFGLPVDNNKLNVNASIYERCIAQFGNNLTRAKEDEIVNNKEDQQDEEEEILNNKEVQTDEGDTDKDEYFTRSEEDGNEYFVGTTLKRGSIEAYKAIYNEKGENALLNEAPQRFINLWEEKKEFVIKYFV